MRSPVLDASTSTAARGRTISDLINQCSRRTPAGTTSQQRSTLPATGRGTICLQGSRRAPGEGQCSPAGGYRTRVCPMADSLALIRGGGHPWSLVTANLEALLTALYVLIDDHVI